jgi:hypothetical protein
MSFEYIKPGDVVTRMLAGAIPLTLKVTEVDDKLITCEAGWQFERESGVEYDPYLHWGSEWGHTGSFLVEKEP